MSGLSEERPGKARLSDLRLKELASLAGFRAGYGGADGEYASTVVPTVELLWLVDELRSLREERDERHGVGDV